MNDCVASALLGGIIGVGIVSIWAMWPLIAEVARHGWRNDR